MATTNQLVDRIKRGLSRASLTMYDATILDELNRAQEALEERSTLPSFIQTTDQFVMLADDYLVDMSLEADPAFIRFIDDMPVQYATGDAEEAWAPIEKFITEEELIDRHQGTGSVPKGWAFVRPSLILRPIPDTTITIRTRYYYRAAAMAVGNSTVWTLNAPSMLVAMAGMEMAQQLRDMNALKYFSEKYKIANKDYIQRLSAEEMAGLSTSRGED